MSGHDEPTRLVEPESDAPESLRRALRAGRELPADARIAALEAKLAPILRGPGGGGSGDGGGSSAGTGAGGGVRPSPAGAATSTAATSSLALKLGVAGIALAVVAGAAISWRMAEARNAARAREREVVRVAQPAERATPPSAPPERAIAAPPQPQAIPEPPRSEPSAASRTAAPPEIELIDRAQRALGARPAEALRALSEHSRLYPRGFFEEEREVLAIQALVALHRVGAARDRADRFRARHPGSTGVRRIAVVLEQADHNSPGAPPPTSEPR